MRYVVRRTTQPRTGVVHVSVGIPTRFRVDDQTYDVMTKDDEDYYYFTAMYAEGVGTTDFIKMPVGMYKASPEEILDHLLFARTPDDDVLVVTVHDEYLSVAASEFYMRLPMRNADVVASIERVRHEIAIERERNAIERELPPHS